MRVVLRINLAIELLRSITRTIFFVRNGENDHDNAISYRNEANASCRDASSHPIPIITRTFPIRKTTIECCVAFIFRCAHNSVHVILRSRVGCSRLS